ncbi:hypothetical protein K469DRAFT_696522 [Zopfia rhizophila CBS 207.26]|uniref:Uncharacterized protein n=1 Tax=Zopfia rhizophila CBS 207.26 TaxID=1314779 RepID=A0A6A6DH67_9PEZI|nr:hypothetical protein K469DRAFT_696522 [Zopfia rhizophila CBS 207.26]
MNSQTIYSWVPVDDDTSLDRLTQRLGLISTSTPIPTEVIRVPATKDEVTSTVSMAALPPYGPEAEFEELPDPAKEKKWWMLSKPKNRLQKHGPRKGDEGTRKTEGNEEGNGGDKQECPGWPLPNAMGEAANNEESGGRKEWPLWYEDLAGKVSVPTMTATPEEDDDESQPIIYPKDTLAAQQRYQDESGRCFKLYRSGRYDIGVTVNILNATLIKAAQRKMVDIGRPKTSKHQQIMAEFWAMRVLWDYYTAAGQKAGIAKENIGRQLQAEYGTNPIPYLDTLPKKEVKKRKAHWDDVVQSYQIHLASLNVSASWDLAKFIPIDEQGKPFWKEHEDGEYPVIVVKIDKSSGFEEEPETIQKQHAGSPLGVVRVGQKWVPVHQRAAFLCLYTGWNCSEHCKKRCECRPEDVS